MTNPDNVGGLPDGMVMVQRSDAMRLAMFVEPLLTGGAVQLSAMRIAELCRAAPAGGDVAPDIKPDGFDAIEISGCDDIEQLRSWAHCMRRERDNWRQRALDAEMELAGDNGLDPPDSAPAGSGEVDLRAKVEMWRDDIRRLCRYEGHRCDFRALAEAIEQSMSAALLRKLQQPAEEDAYVIEQMGRLLAEIAIIVNGPEPALTKWSYHDLPEKVRKLQQGAESVGTRQQTLRRLAGELEACDPDFTRGIAQSLRGRAYILDAVMTGSASQGQEGGNVEG